MTKLYRSLEFGLYLFIFLLPWQTRWIWHIGQLNDGYWEYGSFSLYGTELLLWGLLGLFLIVLIKSGGRRLLSVTELRQRFGQAHIRIYWLFVAVVLASGLSVFWAMDQSVAYHHWVRMLEGAALMAMLLHLRFDTLKLAIVWIASAVVQSGIGIVQFLTQHVGANKWLGLAQHDAAIGGSIVLETASERWLRAYGSLPHPNILAGFLVIAILLLFYVSMRFALRRQSRMLIMGSLAVMTLALFFTFSRSAWLAIILSFAGVMLWLRRRGNASQRQIFYSLLVIMAVIVAIFGTTLSGALEARLVGEQRLEVESIRLRVTFAQQAMTVIQNTRGLGTGIGNYTLGVYGFVNDNWPFWYYQPVHNIYFLVLAEVGILGLGLFLAAILSLLRAALRQLKSLETLFLSLGLCSLLIIGMVDHYTWTLYFGILTFWLVIGLMLRQISPPNAELKD